MSEQATRAVIEIVGEFEITIARPHEVLPPGVQLGGDADGEDVVCVVVSEPGGRRTILPMDVKMRGDVANHLLTTLPGAAEKLGLVVPARPAMAVPRSRG